MMKDYVILIINNALLYKRCDTNNTHKANKKRHKLESSAVMIIIIQYIYEEDEPGFELEPVTIFFHEFITDEITDWDSASLSTAGSGTLWEASAPAFTVSVKDVLWFTVGFGAVGAATLVTLDEEVGRILFKKELNVEEEEAGFWALGFPQP